MRKGILSRAAKLAWLFAALLFSISLAHGQTTFGSITGAVPDPTGAVVPGAGVRVFNVPNLEVGTYPVSITAAGFAFFEGGGLVLKRTPGWIRDSKMEIPVQSAPL